jgi:hypothetical protein
MTSARFIVLALLLSFGTFKVVSSMMTPPTAAELAAQHQQAYAELAAQQQQQQRAARFDELTKKDAAFSALEGRPGLTYDECMYVNTYNGGRLDGAQYLARERCAPDDYSGPDPQPVYIVPRP